MKYNHNDFDINQFKKIWLCEKCGCKYVTKFKNYDLCSTCLIKITGDIHKKMINNPDYSKHF